MATVRDGEWRETLVEFGKDEGFRELAGKDELENGEVRFQVFGVYCRRVAEELKFTKPRAATARPRLEA